MMQFALQLIALEVIALILLRPVILWYLGTRETTRLLRSIDKSLKLLPGVRDARARLRRVA